MTEPLITSRTDWTEDLLQEIYAHIEDIAINDLKLDVYPNQIEIISAEQMIDAYASIGMPVHYNHWSFGKEFLENWTNYQKGKMGLAYEIVINSNPCISYLMEENNAIMQTLVIAHAAFGHNYVFKNNYLFKEWTAAGSIIDYLLFAKNYIRDCELKYGEDEVELVLDAAHALAQHGVDKSRRKYKKKMSEEEAAAEEMRKANEEQQNLDIIIQKTGFRNHVEDEVELDLDLVGDEENLIYFIYKNAPSLEQWKREILRIVYKINQYFYPQGQTKTVNEGFATFTHCYIMEQLEKRGIISPDAMISVIDSNAGVIFQPPYTSRYYRGFNPYALGLSIYKDIRRICENPTDEDREWFPDLAGSDWREAIKVAASDYRDESFIEQYLSPHIIREMNLFSINVNGDKGIVKDISDEKGYREIRRDLAETYNRINYIPEIVVHSAKMKGDRTLVLEYRPFNGRALHSRYANETLEHIKLLWGYNVQMMQKIGTTKAIIFEK